MHKTVKYFLKAKSEMELFAKMINFEDEFKAEIQFSTPQQLKDGQFVTWFQVRLNQLLTLRPDLFKIEQPKIEEKKKVAKKASKKARN